MSPSVPLVAYQTISKIYVAIAITPPKIIIIEESNTRPNIIGIRDISGKTIHQPGRELEHRPVQDQQKEPQRQDRGGEGHCDEDRAHEGVEEADHEGHSEEAGQLGLDMDARHQPGSDPDCRGP